MLPALKGGRSFPEGILFKKNDLHDAFQPPQNAII
jgi:hypothetical protein